jgi:O-antigen ligase
VTEKSKDSTKRSAAVDKSGAVKKSGGVDTNAAVKKPSARQPASRTPGTEKSGGKPTGAKKGAGTARRTGQGTSMAASTAQSATTLSPRVGLAVAIGALLLLVFDIPKATTSNFMTQFAVLLVLGAAGLPLLVVRAMGRATQERDSNETWAARLSIAFVIAALISALFSLAPGIAIVGTYYHGTGCLFVVSLAGCWAIGTGLSRSQRERLELFLIIAALVNGVVAILQQLVGLTSIGLPSFGNQPDGLLGNPVFLGALAAAALVLVAPRFFAKPSSWWLVVVVLGFTLGICSERFPVLLAVVVVAWFVVGAWRRPEEVEPAPPFYSWWQPSAAYAALTVVTIGLGSVVAWLAGGLGVVNHTASSTAGETYGQRFDAWRAGFHALAAKPLFGWGPGQFEAATSNRFSAQVIRQFGGTLFPDGHNIFIEYATTTGLIGLACLIGWLVFALRHRGGPLFGFALVLLASEMVEPLNAGITGVAFLALGGAAVMHRRGAASTVDNAGASERGRDEQDGALSRPLPGWLRITTPVMAIIVAIPALSLVVGDIVLQQSYYQGHDGSVTQAANTAQTADTLLFHAWPDPPLQVSQADYSLGTNGDPGLLPVATQWAEKAARRDPANSALWLNAAQSNGAERNLSAAYQAALNAQRYLPYNTQIFNSLADTAAEQHHNGEAISWLERSLAADPGQKFDSSVLKKLKDGCTTTPLTAQNSTFKLVCPPAATTSAPTADH